MPLYENTKSFAVASDGVRFNPYQKIAVKRIIPIKGTLNYVNLQGGQTFSFSLRIKGANSDATATVQLFDSELLYLTDILGTFQDGEQIQDVETSTYIADVDGAVDYFLWEVDPAPYADSGLLVSTEVIFAGAEEQTIFINKRAAVLEFMRISDSDVTVFFDSVLNTPGILLKPGEYQSINIEAYEIKTMILNSTAAGKITVRQLSR